MSLRFWRLPLHFDAAAMQAELARLPVPDWPVHFNTGYHDGGWSGVALVSPDGDPHRLYAGPADNSSAVATPLLALCPAMAAAVSALPCSVQSARLLRMAAGSVIREHRDHGLGLAEGLVRLHIPIVSHPAVEFYLDGVRVPMGEGECWYLDFGLPHRVQNHSPRERVHLVLDCAVDDRLRAMLPAAEHGEQQLLTLSSGLGESSAQRFEKFRALVLNDPDLQAALLAIDETALFIDEVTRHGRERGHRFTAEDVRAAWQTGRRAWFERHAF